MEEIKMAQPKLINLLSQIDSGELKLPDFQRDYNWRHSKVKKLMDTIQKMHPSGSLLFLKVNQDNQIISERTFESVTNPEKRTEYLVLDGQQRLTSCYYVFYNKGNKSYYLDMKKIYDLYKLGNLNTADLDEDKIIVVKKYKNIPDGELNQHLFPMGCFNSRDEFGTMLSKYKKTIVDKESEYYSFIDEKFSLYCNNFFEYQFPVVELPKELTLDAVCKVFQTINTTGLKLSAFDICVAKFMRYHINLKNKIDEAIDNYSNIKMIADKDKTIVLQTIALLDNLSPKMNQLADNLLDTSFRKWDKAVKGLNKAVELLVEMGVGCDKSFNLLPYQPYIALFGAIVPEVDYWSLNVEKQSEVYDKLKKFFYFTSLTSRYTEGTDNKMREDFGLLCKWILDGEMPTYMSRGVDWNREKMRVATKGSAMGKVILCLVNNNVPKDFYSDRKVGVGVDREASDIHHIFPKAAYSHKDKELLESVFNLTFITSASNKNIKDKTTDKYIYDIMEKAKISETTLKSRFAGHFINEETYHALLNQDINRFIDCREESIRKYIELNVGISINLIDNNDFGDDWSMEDAFIDADE